MNRRQLFSFLLAGAVVPKGKASAPVATLAPKPEVVFLPSPWSPPFPKTIAEAMIRSYRDAKLVSPRG